MIKANLTLDVLFLIDFSWSYLLTTHNEAQSYMTCGFLTFHPIMAHFKQTKSWLVVGVKADFLTRDLGL